MGQGTRPTRRQVLLGHAYLGTTAKHLHSDTRAKRAAADKAGSLVAAQEDYGGHGFESPAYAERLCGGYEAAYSIPATWRGVRSVREADLETMAYVSP
jgi:hypothetical protein